MTGHGDMLRRTDNVSDWIRHEITIHPVNTHMTEEVINVTVYRYFDIDHHVFKIPEPHWYKTLPLDALARETLVPSIICELVGLKGEQPKNFIRHSIDNFHFTINCIRTDLANRGVSIEDLEKRQTQEFP